MKCPYCNNDMEQGYVQGARGVLWSKKKRKIIFWPDETKGDIDITYKLADIKGENSYVCRNCNKVVIDLNEPPLK